MKFIDTHTHFYSSEFDQDRDEAVLRAKEAGVKYVLLPNVDVHSIDQVKRMVQDYPGFAIPMIGIHPTEMTAENIDEQLAVMEAELASDYSYIAIGEIGLDLHWDDKELPTQIKAYRKQLDLAIRYNLPVSIHCREAFEPFFSIMKDYVSTSLRGVIHSFTGTEAELVAIISNYPQLMIALNGVVTFKKAHLVNLLPLIPLDRLLIETDAPYLAPVPKRGKRNESAFLLHTLEYIAANMDITPSELAERTNANAQAMFRIDEFLSHKKE
ncbi:MAG: TatD family hydrolase [Bacteroidaceae bacterium]